MTAHDTPRVAVDGPDADAAALAPRFDLVGAAADCDCRVVAVDDPASIPADADVLVTTNPSPALLGRAAAAGVACLARDDPDFERNLRDAVARATEAAAVARRAARFDAFFDDADTYMAVLDEVGRVRRCNDAFASADADATPFWALDGWVEADRETVRDRTERALAGERVAFEATWEADEERTLAFTLRPVRSDHDSQSVVVEGHDVTARTRLAEDLRASEELHRVTLNNMTDTVLITDDEGRFTYVCPNVHFIFGYTASEIHELETIDELLGDDLFDPAELDAADVLTNVECTATDEDGEEHTLLVNVRRVDIQGGTTLYSCRDITTRKQRERALAHLHRTARDLLYAESVDAIGRRVVEDGTEMLDVAATALYRFDAAEGTLRPVAHSPGFRDALGPPETHHPTDDGPIGAAFVADETRVLDAEAAPSGLARVLVIPLGDHGVFVAGATDGADADDPFDDVTRELADLLSATAEAALDRVARESDLRARDETLQERNRQLTRLNRVNDLIREIDQSLLRAETRDEVEAAVCERLTAADRFAFAWIGDSPPPNETLRPRTWAGPGRGYLDSVSLSLGGDAPALEPACRTAVTGSVTAVNNVAVDLRDGSWRRTALSHGYQSVVSVPLHYDGASYGVLSVYATHSDAFDETTRAVLDELGETVAAALSSVERRRALVNDTVVELTVDVTDDACVFRRLARDADCTLHLHGGVQDADEGVVAFVAIDEGSTDALLDVAADSVAVLDAHVVSDASDEGLVQLTLARPIVATRLADHGAVLQSLTATPDRARVVVDAPDTDGVHTVLGVFDRFYPDFELAGRREHGRDVTTDARFRENVLDRLTDRQLEVVRTAYYVGYFERPRRATGEDVAALLDISSAAFSKHIRTVQRKLLDALLDAPG